MKNFLMTALMEMMEGSADLAIKSALLDTAFRAWGEAGDVEQVDLMVAGAGLG